MIIAYLPNTIGIIGDIFVLYAFLMLQTGTLTSRDYKYLLFNLIGSAGILFSLMFHWNLSAVIIEVAWIIISFYGIYNYWINVKGSQKNAHLG